MADGSSAAAWIFDQIRQERVDSERLRERARALRREADDHERRAAECMALADELAEIHRPPVGLSACYLCREGKHSRCTGAAGPFPDEPPTGLCPCSEAGHR